MVIAALEVELTGGEWWEPFVVPAAVVLVGVLAAAFSWWLTRRTFAHERAMRERDASREALDAVIAEVSKASGTLNRASESMLEYARQRRVNLKQGGHFDYTGAGADVERRVIPELRDTHLSLMASAFRLSVRFPDSEPMIGAFATWRDSLEELIGSYEEAASADDFTADEALKEPFVIHARLGSELKEFLSAARDWSRDPDKT